MIQLEVVPPDYNEHSTWIAAARRSGRQKPRTNISWNVNLLAKQMPRLSS